MYALYSFITDTCHVQSPCPLAKSHLIAVCTRNWKTGWRAPKVQPGLCAAVISSACFHSKWSHSDAEATYVKDRFDQHLPKGQRRRESKVAASEVAINCSFGGCRGGWGPSLYMLIQRHPVSTQLPDFFCKRDAVV